MKQKAIFLGNLKQNEIKQVYKQESLERLHSLVDIYPEIIDQANAKQHQQVLQEVEVAFSTWGMPAFTEEEISLYLPKLRIIFYAAGTVQYFARPFLHQGVRVVSAWAANAVPVAEYVGAQVLLANKGFFNSRLAKDTLYQDRKSYSSSHSGNYGAKIGILGAGMVGRKVIHLLRSYKLHICVYDPFLTEQQAQELQVQKCSLEEVFQTCTVISNHIANLPETVGMLNGKLFKLMQPYATFINTGRGAQLVEQDLYAEMKKIPTRTALLDVTDPEPIEATNPLLELDNVFITPHIAGSQADEVKRMAEYMLDEYQKYEKGQKLQYEVNLKMLETMA